LSSNNICCCCDLRYVISDKDGDTALHRAAAGGHTIIAQELILAGASLDIQNKVIILSYAYAMPFDAVLEIRIVCV
jgi:ankyrin repeat protein